MGGGVFGYARGSTWKKAPTWEGQREAIRAYAAARGWPFQPDRQFFADPAAGRVADLRDRAAGGTMLGRLRRGDRIVATSLDRVFHAAGDCAVVLSLLGRMRVELHLVGLGGPVQGLDAAGMAAALATLATAACSERAAVRMAKSRYGVRPVNGSSPYGQRWLRRPGGTWELVPDEEERALMKQLLAWHEAGHSIDRIRQHLAYTLKLEFYKQRGRRKRLVKWNGDAIWRRIRAEMRLREQEAQPSHEAQAAQAAPMAGVG